MRDQSCRLFEPKREQDALLRFQRFEKSFRAAGQIWDFVNEILNAVEIKLRDGNERDLSVVVGTSLGKALKTFNAIHELCLLGWGEDALVLLRSNVNLLINLGYILGDDDATERVADFIAFSYLERVKYLKTAHGAEHPQKLQMSDDELRMRAKRWDGARIRERAERVPKFHYMTGYALYSSIEHSDAVTLSGYIAEWNEVGPRINAAPSDGFIEVAIEHSIMVLADVLWLFCRYYKIERPDVFAKIKDLLDGIGRR